MKKRLLAVFCAVALLAVLLLPAGAAKGDWDENIIFLALNDIPITLSDSTMPITVGGGTIYVPYFLFDANQNGGVKLGVFNGGQDKIKNTLTLFNSEPKNLTFDLRTGASYNYYPDGEQENPKAVIRNGQIYVSASATCKYFHVEYIQGNITFGTKSYPYIRIRTDDVALDDDTFKSSATNTYLIQLQDYYKSVVGQGSDAGLTTSQPTSPAFPPDEGERRGVRVYLALRCDTGEAGSAMLDALRSEGGGALLLFRTEDLAEQDDLIRRAVGEGHAIGLITSATAPAEAREELEGGNELLSHIARTATRIVLAEDTAVAETLAAEGWLCWKENLSGLPEGRGSGTVYAKLALNLEARESATRITLDDSATSSTVLTRLLRTLREERYDLRLALETEL